ncbi:MAG: MFS transporter [Dysgonamonadaceae bacterium]|jgi:ACS family hexuronate transporter-like MFS transporter|nr:MFS transporter [Dysgonamonadaceae bacterium]
MSKINEASAKMTNYRWTICIMLFFATTVNYLDRQVLSLTWKDFISPEFHWTNNDYGNITTLFSLFYAICMLFAGRFVDWLDTKKGFLWAIGVWSIGAVLHSFCGIATSGITAGQWLVGFAGAKNAIETVGDIGTVINVSVTLFIFARFILALGEAGNFPASIKATAEYFPKKDRAFATSIFNAGSTIGALAAPLTIPAIAEAYGWEMSFIIIGALGFIWMGFWVFIYKKPEKHPKVNKAELDYILSDKATEETNKQNGKEKTSFLKYFKYKQTWAFAFGKFMTDGVWWFYLFWAPAYLSDVYGFKSSSTESKVALFVIYAIVMLSLYGGKLPTIIINKTGKNPYAARMQSMLIFAFFPLLALLAQPLGNYSYWIPVVIIGIAGAAHQSWSANIFSTVSDMFPKKAIATVTGIGGMAGGLGSVIINKSSGVLFDYTEKAWTTINNIPLLSQYTDLGGNKTQVAEFLKAHNADNIATFLKTLENSGDIVEKGINSGYMIVFSVCAVAYLIGWIVMKALVPKYKPITDL